MRCTFLISVVAVSCLVYAVAPQATADSTAEAEADLIALDDAWIDAEVSGDRKSLERILNAQFMATWASGNTVNRNLA